MNPGSPSSPTAFHRISIFWMVAIGVQKSIELSFVRGKKTENTTLENSQESDSILSMLNVL